MKIGFFKGRGPAEGGQETSLWWAVHGNECWILGAGSDEVTHGSELPEANSVELITELELPDIDEEAVDTIIANVLKGGYLEKPGVRDSGEAVLFILVNEAIQRLSEIENDEPSS